jgi:hypothetical protein
MDALKWFWSLSRGQKFQKFNFLQFLHVFNRGGILIFLEAVKRGEGGNDVSSVVHFTVVQSI